MKNRWESYEAFYWFIYFDILHRREWNGGRGRFIPLRMYGGTWRVGVGATCLDVRWWAGPIVRLMNKHGWPYTFSPKGRVGFVSRIHGLIYREEA